MKGKHNMNITPALDNMNCLIYLRVSDESQIKNFSLENQLDYCKKYAKRNNYKVLKVFREEGKSATTLDRPELQSLLDYAEKNKDKLSAVILYRYDRLARNMLQALTLRKKLAEYGIRVLSSTEPVSNDPLGVMFQNLSFMFAEYESQVHKGRVRDGLKKRFMEGYYTGRSPLGYKKSKDEKEYSIEVPGDDFKIVQKTWTLYSSGTKTLQEIADYLNDHGVGYRWKNRTNPVIKQSVQKMFKNKFYMGTLFSKSFGEVPGNHTPMIDEETYYRVQHILSGKSQTPVGTKYIRNNPSFPLRRFVKCGCGKSLTAAFSKNKVGKKYGYYFCLEHRSPSIPSKTIHKTLEGLLDSITPNSDVLNLYNLMLRTKYDKAKDMIEKKRKEVKGNIEDIKRDRADLAQKNFDGIYSDEIYKQLDSKLENRMIVAQVIDSEGLLKKYDIDILINFSNTLFSDLKKAYLASDEGQKRFLLGKIFPKGLVWSNNGFSNTYINPIFRQIEEYSVPEVALGGQKANLFEHLSFLQRLILTYPDYQQQFAYAN